MVTVNKYVGEEESYREVHLDSHYCIQNVVEYNNTHDLNDGSNDILKVKRFVTICDKVILFIL